MRGGETIKRLCIVIMMAVFCIVALPSGVFASSSLLNGITFHKSKLSTVDLSGTPVTEFTDGDTGTGLPVVLNDYFYADLGSERTIYRYEFIPTSGDYRLMVYDDSKKLLADWVINSNYEFSRDVMVTNVRYIGVRAIETGVLKEVMVMGEPDKIPPLAPKGLVLVPGEEKLTLSWSANTESDLNGYNLYLNAQKVNTSIVKGTTSYTFSGLTPDTLYTVSVTALDRTGNESTKSSLTGTPLSAPPPPDTTPPAKPIGLTGSGADKQAILKWTSNKEKDLAGYIVYQDGKKVSTVSSAATIVDGLENGKTYSFAVSAYDHSGNESEKSVSVNVTPQDKINVVATPNMDSIILHVSGGTKPYSVQWGSGNDTVNETQYTITGLTANTNYTVTVTDANGLKWTGTINTGKDKGYVPPTMPNPQETFQRMLDVFGTAGTIAIAVIGGAVLLGIMCLLALWGWRLLKQWLSRAK